jgi:hypothetical protein
MYLFGREYLDKADWRREIASIFPWVGLNLADLGLTIASMMTMDGRFVEGNPVAALIGENIAGLAAYKIALTLVAIVLSARIRRLKILPWLNIVMAAVVGWNLALLIAS